MSQSWECSKNRGGLLRFESVQREALNPTGQRGKARTRSFVFDRRFGGNAEGHGNTEKEKGGVPGKDESFDVEKPWENCQSIFEGIEVTDVQVRLAESVGISVRDEEPEDAVIALMGLKDLESAISPATSKIPLTDSP
jgi:hypothetical protein